MQLEVEGLLFDVVAYALFDEQSGNLYEVLRAAFVWGGNEEVTGLHPEHPMYLHQFFDELICNNRDGQREPHTLQDRLDFLLYFGEVMALAVHGFLLFFVGAAAEGGEDEAGGGDVVFEVHEGVLFYLGTEGALVLLRWQLVAEYAQHLVGPQLRAAFHIHRLAAPQVADIGHCIDEVLDFGGNEQLFVTVERGGTGELADDLLHKAVNAEGCLY